MPASEFSWAGEARLPIFQVYGTKRKAAQGQTPHWPSDSQLTEEPNAAKRPCPWGANGEMEEDMASEEMMMENNNHLILEPQHLQQIQQQQEANASQTPGIWSQPQQLGPRQQSLQSPFTQQSAGGVMDLCGETFTAFRDETEEALMTMDSDCTPDPEQYRVSTPNPEVTMPIPVSTNQSGTDFCKEFCGVGEPSPSSSCVRCYCKPSWEGMMTMRPYISDIY